MKINLLNETNEILKQYGYTLKDIVCIMQKKWIVDKNYKYALINDSNRDELVDLLNVDYDNGYGLPEINPSLILCGKNFWLERNQYDGSEWWEFKTYPNIDDMKEIKLWKIKVKEE